MLRDDLASIFLPEKVKGLFSKELDVKTRTQMVKESILWPILMILNFQLRNSVVNNLLTLYKTFLISCPANHTAVKFPFPSVIKKNK